MLSPLKHVFPFKKDQTSAIPLIVLDIKHFPKWLKNEAKTVQSWVKLNGFKGEPGQLLSLPGTNHEVKAILLGVEPKDRLYCLGNMNEFLQNGTYALQDPFKLIDTEEALLGFALGAYRFYHFMAERKKKAVFFKITPALYTKLEPYVATLYWVRDLINLPAESLGPTQLALEAKELAKAYKAKCEVIVG